MTHSHDYSNAARADYRILRRNGAVVPFEPSKISTAMTKGFMAGVGGTSASISSAWGQATSASADAMSVTSAGVDGASPGGAGGDEDGDDDGDGDGPRRRSRPRRKSPRTSAARRNTPAPKQKPDRAHSRALFAFALVTTLALGTVLACALNGQPNIAEKVLLAFGSIAGLATALLRPK
jgi:hypothetical protein